MQEAPTTRFRIERLAAHHNREAFSCGSPPIDRWFHAQAGQQSRREIIAVHLAIDNRSEAIVGFYTLCNFTTFASDLPLAIGRQLPRTPVPVHLLGYLGVSIEYQRQGIGETLVNLAAVSAEQQTAVSASIGLLVHARDEELRAWYLKLGFLPLPAHPLHAILTMAHVRRSIAN